MLIFDLDIFLTLPQTKVKIKALHLSQYMEQLSELF